MGKGLKDKIIKLRLRGESYRDIVKTLNCSSGTVAYHCQNEGLNYMGLRKNLVPKEEIKKMRDLKKIYGIKQTAKLLGRAESTIKRHTKGIKTEKIFETIQGGYERTKRRRFLQKTIGVILKGGKCEKCGYDKNYAALDFHHRDPSVKEMSIGGRVMSNSKLKKEIAKCDLLCANCHRETHSPDKNIMIMSDFIKRAKIYIKKHIE